LSALMPANCSQTPDVAAMRKISALEDELSKLREQIAMIVINQEHAGEERKCVHMHTHTLVHHTQHRYDPI